MTSQTERVTLNREEAQLDKYDFALTLSRPLSKQQLDTLTFVLSKNGFEHLLVDDEKLSKSYVIFLAYNDTRGILKQAEKLEIYKKSYSNCHHRPESKLQRVLAQKEMKELNHEARELEQTQKFCYSGRKNFLFSSKALDIDEDKLIENEATAHHHHDHDDKEDWDAYIKLFTSGELTRIIWSLLKSIEIKADDEGFFEQFKPREGVTRVDLSPKLLDMLKQINVLEIVTPLHNKNLDMSLESINNITDYYGQNVGIYFKFMEFYTRWLTPPAVCGVLIFFFTSEKHKNLKLILETMYSVMIMIWASLFLKFWKRRSSELCVKWHTYGQEFNNKDLRVEFRGYTRLNLVTGLPQKYFPFRKKLVRYTISTLFHLPVMMLALTLMVCFLNMRGYVDPKHWIYIPSLSLYAEKGGMFDKDTLWRVVPSLFQVGSILLLSKINKMASGLTTRWENHRTKTSFQNSLVLKRFIFEVAYLFIHLAYIGFWRLDIGALQKELVILFASDEIRRLVSETVVPYCLKMTKNRNHYHLDNKKNDAQVSDEKEYIRRKVQEIELDEYDSFDDYLEMIVQFGYITMFAAAFPLSGVFSLFFNGLEILSDYYKLKNLHRRPLPQIANGIGSYKEVIDIMSYLCILTNCILIACNFLKAEEGAKAELMTKEGDSTFAKVIIAEHVILVLVYLLRKLINDEPAWVRIYLKRRNYMKK